MVPVGGKLEIRHEVDRERITEAGLDARERYRVSLTDKCLGARWWDFGGLGNFEGVRFKQRREGQIREEGNKQGEDGQGKYVRGEMPDDLALVIEKGDAEFEIRQILY